jgi:hypothetical protein
VFCGDYCSDVDAVSEVKLLRDRSKVGKTDFGSKERRGGVLTLVAGKALRYGPSGPQRQGVHDNMQFAKGEGQ